ncbi:formate dehydrogenase accessory sulfurtransferase FdhD [Calderihabitans maritimus]|uniref:Sulfur carrier protein FdhD n=1 Tax=Calderihabitans maritimus TaxID=1246530 RepID=A0A1Z5HRT0_9FIRM|nr:formate dehydrogenase accessory sulfurtransferase FdhD [Calderihabitans maritimus]GAW92031.1 formate dehydrogenase family accessory protein FdhD [Calderihabitans maritimus]
MDQRIQEVEALRKTAEVTETFTDRIVKEMPITIYLNEKEIVTLLCSPDNLEELAVGFLSSEGLIKDPKDLIRVRAHEEQGMVWVETARESQIAEKLFLKRYITTGCGKGTTFYHWADANLAKPITSNLRVTAAEILEAMRKVQQISELYKTTGGVHGAALCERDKIFLYREDVGRHNAVDKIIGRCFLDGTPTADKILLTSGRISSEILIKVAKMGIPILVSRSAPTSLALAHAEELGITVVGFARARRLNVYTYPERIQ